MDTVSGTGSWDVSALILAPVVVGVIISALLVIKSAKDFSRAGPRVREISRSYKGYGLYAIARLALFSVLLTSFFGGIGTLVYLGLCLLVEVRPSAWGGGAAAAVAVGLVTLLQFCAHLLYIPGGIAASSHYRMSRFYALWSRLSPARLAFARGALIGTAIVSIAAAVVSLAMAGQWAAGAAFAAAAVAAGVVLIAASRWSEPRPVHRTGGSGRRAGRPNILMLGCDTLRADRVGNGGYPRHLTPNIDRLIARGTHFTNCYVPVARTAPSLLSYMTGAWPHLHGIRDNFVSPGDLHQGCAALPALLREAGYRTAVVSDWAGSDFSKFPLGFDCVDAPEDQWNVKYFIRQGPKDLRLFLSLFTHNRFGKKFLPELYYLAGVPLTAHLGRRTRELIGALGADRQPFFINLFAATAHPPFGSEYPHYTSYTRRDYHGESKFVMCKLTDPDEIIRSQREPKESFDLEQILDLYDGCVENFDREVGRILHYLERSGLADDTVVMIYSDHGMEFFEHDTWGQGNSVLGDSSARVPLVLAAPGRRGQGRVEHIIRTVDLAPTLLDLVGQPIPTPMVGRSLMDVLDDPGCDPGLTAYFETGIWLSRPAGMPPDHIHYPDILDLLEVPCLRSGVLAVREEYRRAVIEARDRMVRHGEWMLVYFPLIGGQFFKLFNVCTDPDCKHDLAGSRPDIVAALKPALLDWVEKGNAAGGHAAGLRAGPVVGELPATN